MRLRLLSENREHIDFMYVIRTANDDMMRTVSWYDLPEYKGYLASADVVDSDDPFANVADSYKNIGPDLRVDVYTFQDVTGKTDVASFYFYATHGDNPYIFQVPDTNAGFMYDRACPSNYAKVLGIKIIHHILGV